MTPPRDSKKYYQENKSVRVNYSRRYRQQNPEIIKLYMVKWRKDNKRRIARYNKKYSKTLRDRIYNCCVAELEKKQRHRCEICGAKTKLVVDHDHHCCSGGKSCGRCVRGLLCKPCNWLLGYAHDSIKVLKNAIKYLEES